MPIEIKMPALSPTMEEGTLAKWHVKAGDTVAAGDILTEIETDKATMEFEAVDEGTIASLSVPAGTEGVKVGTVIAVMSEEGEEAAPAPKPAAQEQPAPVPQPSTVAAAPAPAASAPPPVASAPESPSPAPRASGKRINASPLARRIASERGIDLSTIAGTGPHGRIVRADVDGARPSAAKRTAERNAKAASRAGAA